MFRYGTALLMTSIAAILFCIFKINYSPMIDTLYLYVNSCLIYNMSYFLTLFVL
ncbi:hypothetical protein BD770DRAFT_395489, partial [Pilaira anomala]